jgi:hypothetical protein
LSLQIKQRSAGSFNITLKDEDTNEVITTFIGTETYTFTVVNAADHSAAFTVDDADIDVTDIATGIVVVPFTATNTDQVTGEYLGELCIATDADNIAYTKDIEFSIIKTHKAAS